MPCSSVSLLHVLSSQDLQGQHGSTAMLTKTSACRVDSKPDQDNYSLYSEAGRRDSWAATSENLSDKNSAAVISKLILNRKPSTATGAGSVSGEIVEKPENLPGVALTETSTSYAAVSTLQREGSNGEFGYLVPNAVRKTSNAQPEELSDNGLYEDLAGAQEAVQFDGAPTVYCDYSDLAELKETVGAGRRTSVRSIASVAGNPVGVNQYSNAQLTRTNTLPPAVLSKDIRGYDSLDRIRGDSDGPTRRVSVDDDKSFYSYYSGTAEVKASAAGDGFYDTVSTREHTESGNYEDMYELHKLQKRASMQKSGLRLAEFHPPPPPTSRPPSDDEKDDGAYSGVDPDRKLSWSNAQSKGDPGNLYRAPDMSKKRSRDTAGDV